MRESPIPKPITLPVGAPEAVATAGAEADRLIAEARSAGEAVEAARAAVTAAPEADTAAAADALRAGKAAPKPTVAKAEADLAEAKRRFAACAKAATDARADLVGGVLDASPAWRATVTEDRPAVLDAVADALDGLSAALDGLGANSAALAWLARAEADPTFRKQPAAAPPVVPGQFRENGEPLRASDLLDGIAALVATERDRLAAGPEGEPQPEPVAA